MRTGGLLLAAVAALPAAPALACAPAPDQRPFAQRLADAPLAFVGTVTAVTGRRVSFAVHHSIHGASGETRTVEALPPSTCAIHFVVGQRWLYAGPATGQPSVLLRRDARGLPADDFGRLRRVDDTRAQLPAAWQACTRNAQCEPVAIGCQRTAAHAAHAAAAAAQATRLLGDHRAMECATQPAEILPLQAPQCVASRCGQWVVDLRLPA